MQHTGLSGIFSNIALFLVGGVFISLFATSVSCSDMLKVPLASFNTTSEAICSGCFLKFTSFEYTGAKPNNVLARTIYRHVQYHTSQIAERENISPSTETHAHSRRAVGGHALPSSQETSGTVATSCSATELDPWTKLMTDYTAGQDPLPKCSGTASKFVSGASVTYVKAKRKRVAQ